MTVTSQANYKFAKTICNLISNELFALIKEKTSTSAMGSIEEDCCEVSVAHSTVTPRQLGQLALMQSNGEISSTMAKKILSIMFEAADSNVSPYEIAVEHGFELVSDSARILAVCRQVIAEHPNEVEVYRKGGKFGTKIRKLFTGKAMAACRGNAHPERLQEAVEEALEEVAERK